MILQPDTIQTGMIVLYAGSTAPEGWLLCHGQTIRRNHYPNLCAFLPEGTETGTHLLPDLRGRAVVGQGASTGLSERTIDEHDGREYHSLVSDELPSHGHTVQARNAAAVAATPMDMMFAASLVNRTDNVPLDTPYHHTANASAHADLLVASGENEQHTNMMPFVVLNFIIKA